MKKTLSRFHAHRLQASDDFLLETKEKKMLKDLLQKNIYYF